MVVDHSLFDQICDFKVECFDPGLSDVHCALNCEIKVSRSSSSKYVNEVEPLVKKKERKRSDTFGRAICTSEVLRLKQYLSQTTANLIDINQVDIEIKEVILIAAEVAGATRFEKPRICRNVWFNSLYKRREIELQKSLQKHKRRGN